MSAALEIAYRPSDAEPRSPPIEEMMMNEPPPRAARCGHTMFASQKLLRTLAPITRSYTSSDAPAAGPRYGFTAALLTKMSMPPHSAMVWSTRLCRSSLRAMWHGITAASPPLARIDAATASHASALRLDTTTLAPCSARRSAMARPMPLLEPVTMATLPVRSNSDIAWDAFPDGRRRLAGDATGEYRWRARNVNRAERCRRSAPPSIVTRSLSACCIRRRSR